MGSLARKGITLWGSPVSCVGIVLLLVPVWMPPVLAQNSDFVCYMQISGSTVDLSSLCGNAGGQATSVMSAPVAISAMKSFSTAEQAFLAEFQELARNYPDSVGQVLQTDVSDRQTFLIASAKMMCRMVQSGGTAVQAHIQKQLSHGNSSGDIIRQQITYALAIKHFCPDLVAP